MSDPISEVLTDAEWHPRFFSHVDMSAGVDGCWPWTASTNSKGYGSFSLPGRVIAYAHRTSYAIAHGAIPEGMWVLHRCDNPPCVNPAHLWLGTPSDNMVDKVQKGRDHQTRKTHCPAGHPYAGDNLLVGHSFRRCRLCNADSQRRYKAKLKARGQA